MNFHRLLSQSGKPTLQTDGRFWHSSYDPDREAAQWVSQTARNLPVTLVVGDGLGYAEKAWAAACPGTRVASLGFFPGLRDRFHWDCHDPRPLARWLRGFLHGKSGPSLQVAVWPAAKNLAPEVLRQVLDTIAVVLREEEANLATHVGMGRVWLRNVIRRSRAECPPLRLKPHPGPVVLAASGSSLEALVRRPELRPRYRLVAVSSAVAALQARGIIPDACAVTDGGYWAGRLEPRDPIPRLAPASSFVPHREPPWLAFSQGWIYEDYLFGEGKVPNIPARGTVTYSALQYLETAVTGTLITAGLDLCDTRGCRHLTPHPIDAWWKEDRLSTRATRVSEEVAVRGARILAPGVTQTTAAALYASGFGSEPQPGRYRLAPSPATVPGFLNLSPEDLEGLLPPGKAPPLEWETLGRSRLLRDGLLQWKRDVETAFDREEWDNRLLMEIADHLLPTERLDIFQAEVEGRDIEYLLRGATRLFRERWGNLWWPFLR